MPAAGQNLLGRRSGGLRDGHLLLQPDSGLGASRDLDWLGRVSGEGAPRDQNTAVGVGMEGSSGTAEPRSSRQLGHLESTSREGVTPSLWRPLPHQPLTRTASWPCRCPEHSAYLHRPSVQLASHCPCARPSLTQGRCCICSSPLCDRQAHSGSGTPHASPGTWVSTHPWCLPQLPGRKGVGVLLCIS